MKNQRGIFRNAKFFALLAILLIVLAIPVTLNLLNQNTYHPSLAAATTSLTLSPATGTGNPGDPISFDLSLNPGNSNLVSTLTLYITYNGSVIKPTANGFAPGDGTASFSPCSSPSGFLCVFDGPTYNTCNGNQCTMYIVLSIGNDFTKAIKTTTTVAKLNFTAQANGVSTVDFDPQTSILSIASTDSPGENVLQSKTPATVNVGNVSVTTTPPTQQTPIPTTPTNLSPIPTNPLPTSPNSSPVPTSSSTITPTPTTSSGNKCEDVDDREKKVKKREKDEDKREQNEKLRENKVDHDLQIYTGNHHGGCLGAYNPNNPNTNVNCNDNGSNGTPQSFWDWVKSFLGIH